MLYVNNLIIIYLPYIFTLKRLLSVKKLLGNNQGNQSKNKEDTTRRMKYKNAITMQTQQYEQNENTAI